MLGEDFYDMILDSASLTSSCQSRDIMSRDANSHQTAVFGERERRCQISVIIIIIIIINWPPYEIPFLAEQ